MGGITSLSVLWILTMHRHKTALGEIDLIMRSSKQIICVELNTDSLHPIINMEFRHINSSAA